MNNYNLRIDNIDECCGCRACFEICPQKAISMELGTDSFNYPRIEEAKCTHCSVCYKVCPTNYTDFYSVSFFKAYAVTSKDSSLIKNSSSGGAFGSICEYYLKNNYTIWGVVFDKNLRVIHDSGSDTYQCARFRKSKYIQSDTNGCFEKICSQLKEGRKVLFSGVPCQVAALKQYLSIKKVESSNLVTVSLLCHGVPSQKMFDEHLTYLSKKYQSKVISYTFRNKEPVDGTTYSRTCKIIFENGRVLFLKPSNDAFLKGYYERLFLRSSCGNCKFARSERISDYTIGDAWNIEKIYPFLKPLEGVSLIIINTQRVLEAFSNIVDTLNAFSVDLKWAFESQDIFKYPPLFHKNRQKFFKLWANSNFEKAVWKSTKRSMIMRIRSFLNRFFVV